MIIVHLDTYDSILLKSNDKSFHALYYIIKQMDLEKNQWYADKTNKTAVCEKLSISLPALEKMLASLKERNLVITVQRGLYSLAPELIEGY
jgi:DNA-binding IscR family transcriptional regulator